MPQPILLHTTFQNNQYCLQNPDQIQICFIFMQDLVSENENFLSSLCIANFQLKISKKKICYRGPETSKKQKNKLQFFFEFFRFLGGSRIIRWPYFYSPLCHALYQPTYQISKESLNVCRIQSKYKWASFMLKHPGEVLCVLQIFN